jgi:hypothetical protein
VRLRHVSLDYAALADRLPLLESFATSDYAALVECVAAVARFARLRTLTRLVSRARRARALVAIDEELRTLRLLLPPSSAAVRVDLRFCCARGFE